MRERPIWFDVDGERVHGMLHLPERRPAPAVVMLHGFTGQRIESGFIFVHLARALAEAGIAALRFDFRGSGESQGRFLDLTIEGELEDALTALRFLRARPDIKQRRVGVLGLSLGSVVAALAAGEDPGIHALCLWATLARPQHRFRLTRATRATLVSQGFIDYKGDGFPLGPGFFESAARVDPLAAMEHYRGPLLCVHGERDYLPLEEPQLVLDASPAETKALYVVPDGDHVFRGVAPKNEAVTVTRDFFVQSLLPPSRRRKKV